MDPVVIYDEYGGTRMIRTESWKYMSRFPNGPNELYDLNNDPDERFNLAGDKGYSARCKSLNKELENWFEQYVEPNRDGRSKPVTGSGQLRPLGRLPGDDSAAFTALEE